METTDMNDYEQVRAERDLAAIEIERLEYDIRNAQIAYNHYKDGAKDQRTRIEHEQQQLAQRIIIMVEERMQYIEAHAGAERSMRHRLEHAINELHGQLVSCSNRMRQARSPQQYQAVMLECDYTRAQLSQAEQQLFSLTDERGTKRVL
jgi:predicted  nucleic acid-binding Zn-ribbon protein